MHGTFILFGAKAGLEHRNYPYDLIGLKKTTSWTIPSLIPTVPVGDYRTVRAKQNYCPIVLSIQYNHKQVSWSVASPRP